jgi:nucleoside-diphosphate-sugar epimerase
MLETQCTFIDACRQIHGRSPHGQTFRRDDVIGFALSLFADTRRNFALPRTLRAFLDLLASWAIHDGVFAGSAHHRLRTCVFPSFRGCKALPVDLEDIAKAAFAMLTRPGHEGKTYMMSGPEALSMTEIAEQISLAIGSSVRYVDLSPEERKRAQLAAGIPAYVVDALDVQSSLRRQGNGEDVVHPETHMALGIRPTTFAEFARHHATDFRGK